MNIELKKSLAAALIGAFSKVIHADSIHDRSSISDYEPLEESGGRYTVFAGPSFKTAFEPVDGVDAKAADIMFEIQFQGCTYDKEQNLFSWDGKEHEFVFGNFMNNLMLVSMSNPSEEDWYEEEGLVGIDDLEDTEITKAILTPLFANMGENEKNNFLMAVFAQVIKGTPAPTEV